MADGRGHTEHGDDGNNDDTEQDLDRGVTP